MRACVFSRTCMYGHALHHDTFPFFGYFWGKWDRPV
jgi:hypothetical protein